MKTFKNLSFATCVALMTNVLACATSAEDPIEQPTQDAGGVDSTSRVDSGLDAAKDALGVDGKTDTGAALDTGAKDTRPADADTCAPGSTETRACGGCGSQSRFCLSEGYHTAWTDCAGERADVECKIGEKRSSDCGNCGKAVDFCDTKTCAWITGLCSGEGPCAPGDSEATKASCSVVDEVRTRTCDDKCAWSTFSSCGLPKGWLPMDGGPLTGRIWPALGWTGSKMIVWGGDGSSYKGDGAIYDFPSNKWTMMPATPSGFNARRNPMGVWTGSKFLVWGGRDYSVAFKDGAIFDPAGAGGAGSWTTMAASPLTARFWSAAVWSTTTNELLVWGGCTGWSGLPCTSVAADGAAYNPATNTWTAIPAAPITARGDTAFGWNGTELVIAGGQNATGPVLDGARYDPAAHTWIKFSEPSSGSFDGRRDPGMAFDGSSVFEFGGRTTTTSTTAKKNGAFYTPGVGWTVIPDASDTAFPSGALRYNSAAWIGGGKLFVFSGQGTSSSSSSIGGFASFDPSTSSWTPLDETGAPSPRGRAIAVWTGREAIVWGGSTSDYLSGYVATGAIYRP